MEHPALLFSDPVPYAAAVRLQEALVAERIRDAIPDVLLLMEHPPVVTLGRRARDKHLLVPPETLAMRGVDFAVAARGGDVTYHAPGQCVAYPILKLGAREADAHGYLHNLEEAAIRTAGRFGVQAFRREGKSGAWTAAGKIAAIGFRLRRWVTFHGMSLNVDLDLAGFEAIVPCGIPEPVASLQSILGDRCPTVPEVHEALAGHLSEVTGRGFAVVSARDYAGSAAIETALAGCGFPPAR